MRVNINQREIIETDIFTGVFESISGSFFYIKKALKCTTILVETYTDRYRVAFQQLVVMSHL